MVEHDVARRVAGAVADVEREIADADLVAIDEPSGRFEGAADDAVSGAVLGEAVDPVTVGLVRAFDRNAELLGQQPSAAAMVDMAVGQQDLLDRDPGLLQPRP